LAKLKKIPFRELGKEIFVAHNVKSPSRDHVIDAFRKHRVPLNIGIELSSIETIKQFVDMKLGIAFVPKLCVEKELRERSLVSIPIEGFRHKRTFQAIYLRDKVHTHAATSFLEVIRSLARP
jgi:DNA-binding transcriptional LysR family regulator